jgi:hypothetical protein
VSTVRDRSRSELIQVIYQLRKMHAEGKLGGEQMPEDENPGLALSSVENYHYFTLPIHGPSSEWKTRSLGRR